MTFTEPVAPVLVFSGVAALLAALGVVPFLGGRRPAPAVLGAAAALAGGLMIGAGYLLIDRGLDHGAFTTVLGIAGGILYTLVVQAWGRLELPSPGVATDRETPAEGEPPEPALDTPRLLLRDALHSAAEGVAIGVAFLVEPALGIFVAGALALHNVGEAMILTDAVLTDGPAGSGGGPATPLRAAGLAVATNLPQPLLALVAFALHPLLAGFLPAALGFAAGSLLFLVLTELLPGAYPRLRHDGVAAVVGIGAGAVVLLEAVLVP